MHATAAGEAPLDAEDAPGGRPGRAPRGRRALIAALVLVLFLGLSGLLSTRLLGSPGSRVYGGQDPVIFLWWLRWVPYALAHGIWPLHTDWINHPYGVNAMWNTSMPLLGLLCAPLTLAVGPLATFNLLLAAAPALSGWTCFLVARRLLTRAWPAVLAGLLYGFSPYMVAQSAGHLQLTFALFPPVLLLLCVELLHEQRRRSWVLGLLLGAAVSLQLYTGEELLATSALVAGASTLLLALSFPREALRRARYVGSALAVAGATTLVLTGAALREQFLGGDVIHGAVQRVLPGADLLGPLVPTRFQLLHWAGPALVHRINGANLSEQTSYLGLPLLALTVLCIVMLRRSRHVWLAVPLAVSFVLMLGAHLRVNGRMTDIPLPGAVVQRLPVFASIIPVRLSLYVTLFSALLLAAWVDAQVGRRPWGRVPRWVPAAGLAAVALVPLIPSGPLHAVRVTRPAFFGSAADVALLPPQGVALLVPYPSPFNAAAMWWQAEAGMRFKMPGGYFLAADENGRGRFGRQAGPLATVLEGIRAGLAPPPPQSGAYQAAAAELAGHPYDAIIVGPMPHQLRAAAFVQTATGVRPRAAGGVWLFLLPR